ncbi:hypothetical protein GBP346_B2759 [Burkholderia pseudomallei MSHR346]|nr:hypothetical protein GBP346_B2759 [Burkholderia pseudomallei MSHR346]
MATGIIRILVLVQFFNDFVNTTWHPYSSRPPRFQPSRW